MNILKMLKRIFIFSNIITVNCLLQMLYLPNKCFNLMALWKASSFLAFCIYYLVLYTRTMIGKENYAKYLDNNSVTIYYSDVVVKLIIVLLPLLFVKYLRGSVVEHIGYIIQIILFLCDIILQIKIFKIYKHIFFTPKEQRKQYYIDIKQIKCTQKNSSIVSNMILLSIVLILANSMYLIMVFLVESIKIFYGLFCINIIICYIFLYLSLNKYNEILLKIKKKKYHRFGIGVILYNVFCLFFSIQIIYKYSLSALLLLIFVSIAFLIFSIIYILIPMIKMIIGMQKYLDL